jgi:heterodisulfide reductase subunit B
MSALAVAEVLGVKLTEIPGWNCCGSMDAVYSCDPALSLTLAARNLDLVEEMNMDLVTLCSACYFTLRRAKSILKNQNTKWTKNNLLRKRAGSEAPEVRVRHLLDVVVNDIGVEEVSRHVRRSMEDLRVASYYGCLIVKPPGEDSFDNPEHPQSMESLVEALGATSVDLLDKTRCCGASFSLTAEDVMVEMSKRILENAKRKNVDCVITPCPMCQFNLDAKQGEVESSLGSEIRLPILFFTQLLGLAFGLSPKRLGLEKHCVSPADLLRRLSPLDHPASVSIAGQQP